METSKRYQIVSISEDDFKTLTKLSEAGGLLPVKVSKKSVVSLALSRLAAQVAEDRE